MGAHNRMHLSRVPGAAVLSQAAIVSAHSSFPNGRGVWGAANGARSSNRECPSAGGAKGSSGDPVFGQRQPNRRLEPTRR